MSFYQRISTQYLVILLLLFTVYNYYNLILGNFHAYLQHRDKI